MQRLLEIDGGSWNVCDEGQGEPLLLVHGFPLDHTMWRGQIDGLAQVCRVVAPDLRGFGRSPIPPSAVTMEQFADDLSALLDGLAVRGPVTFCGLSMGGYIAWQFWRRHPERVRRLILCDTRAAADPPEVAQGRLDTAERVLREGVRFLVETMTERLFAAATRRNRPDLVEATQAVMQGCDPRGVAAALRGMAVRPDATDLLPRIRVPALIVCGEEDAISTVSEMSGLAAAVPGARFLSVPDAGHLAPLEQPDVVNAAIRDFLNDYSMPSSSISKISTESGPITPPAPSGP